MNWQINMCDISVCIPAHFRPEILIKCLKEIANQVMPTDEVIVGLTSEDSLSAIVVDEMRNEFICPLLVIEDSLGSVINKLNIMAETATKSWLATIDDDAIPENNWLNLIREKLIASNLGALGGRDDQKNSSVLTKKVGIISFYGRIIGNHERGDLDNKHVDFLKGVNFIVKKNFFPIATEMIARGPEPHWELYLCRKAAKGGYSVIYSSHIKVSHFPAKRLEFQRSPNPKLAYLYNRNLILALGLNKEYSKMIRVFIFQLILGGSPAYGFIKFMVTLKKTKDGYLIWKNAYSGLIDALIMIKRNIRCV